MNMKEFCNTKYEEMMAQIRKIQDSRYPPIKEGEVGFTTVNRFMSELKAYILEMGFDDKESEIAFFKETKPRFEAHQIFFRECFLIQNSLLNNDENRRVELQQQLTVIKKHFRKHHFLYSYFRLEKSTLDHWLFLRNVQEIPFITHRSIIHMDTRFETIGSYRFAKFLAYERLKKEIERFLEKDNNPIHLNDRPLIQWTGQKVQLVELLYALKVAGVFNNGQAELKSLAESLEKMFGVQIGDVYRIFQEIRLRKKGRTVFLDSLKEKLESYMEQAEGM
ncbi:RteC domain-containing protein [Echinicola marina]|uniref:RteC domain-containing protein n=1 Tax=Echinicola marina TaxID=2859768 RepID=UPI001CF620D2|nr:RteC domain-containing protein [Echinicola marina]UCS92180.1 RteC domain-containing protein [Echinicola marina]